MVSLSLPVYQIVCNSGKIAKCRIPCGQNSPGWTGAPGSGFWYPGPGVASAPHFFLETQRLTFDFQLSTSDPRPLLFQRKIVPVLQNTIAQLLLTREGGPC